MPPSTPPELAALLASCWQADPAQRPGFDAITAALELMLAAAAEAPLQHSSSSPGHPRSTGGSSSPLLASGGSAARVVGASSTFAASGSGLLPGGTPLASGSGGSFAGGSGVWRHEVSLRPQQPQPAAARRPPQQHGPRRVAAALAARGATLASRVAHELENGAGAPLAPQLPARPRAAAAAEAARGVVAPPRRARAASESRLETNAFVQDL